MTKRSLLTAAVAVTLTLSACARRPAPASETPSPAWPNDVVFVPLDSPRTAIAAAPRDTASGIYFLGGPEPDRKAGFPAGAQDAQARLAASPRHAEWVTVRAGADSVVAWMVFPERSSPAPVVVVIHEIFGLTPWIRAVADQLAAEGFIAIAPDLLTMERIPGAPANPNPDSARAAIRGLTNDRTQRYLDAVARFGMAHPAALQRYGVVGFCWGGTASFEHAAHAPGLGAAVVYYGSSPDAQRIARVRAPVLGFYGENDARVNATIGRADSVMRASGRMFVHSVAPGAGHGFLRQQDGQSGANLLATQAAWPNTIAFFRRHLEAR